MMTHSIADAPRSGVLARAVEPDAAAAGRGTPTGWSDRSCCSPFVGGRAVRRSGARHSPPSTLSARGTSGRSGSRRTAAAARRASTASSPRPCPRSRPARAAASSRPARRATRAPGRRPRRRARATRRGRAARRSAAPRRAAPSADHGVCPRSRADAERVADAHHGPAVAELGRALQRLGHAAPAGEAHGDEVEERADDVPEVAPARRAPGRARRGSAALPRGGRRRTLTSSGTAGDSGTPTTTARRPRAGAGRKKPGRPRRRPSWRGARRGAGPPRRGPSGAGRAARPDRASDVGRCDARGRASSARPDAAVRVDREDPRALARCSARSQVEPGERRAGSVAWPAGRATRTRTQDAEADDGAGEHARRSSVLLHDEEPRRACRRRTAASSTRTRRRSTRRRRAARPARSAVPYGSTNVGLTIVISGDDGDARRRSRSATSAGSSSAGGHALAHLELGTCGLGERREHLAQARAAQLGVEDRAPRRRGRRSGRPGRRPAAAARRAAASGPAAGRPAAGAAAGSPGDAAYAVAGMACSRPTAPAMVSRNDSVQVASPSSRAIASRSAFAPPSSDGAGETRAAAASAATGHCVTRRTTRPTTTAMRVRRPTRCDEPGPARATFGGAVGRPQRDDEQDARRRRRRRRAMIRQRGGRGHRSHPPRRRRTPGDVPRGDQLVEARDRRRGDGDAVGPGAKTSLESTRPSTPLTSRMLAT